MTPKVNYIVISIEESNDLYTMSNDDLYGIFLVHEQRMQEHKEKNQTLKLVHDARTIREGVEVHLEDFKAEEEEGTCNSSIKN